MLGEAGRGAEMDMGRAEGRHDHTMADGALGTLCRGPAVQPVASSSSCRRMAPCEGLGLLREMTPLVPKLLQCHWRTQLSFPTLRIMLQITFVLPPGQVALDTEFITHVDIRSGERTYQPSE